MARLGCVIQKYGEFTTSGAERALSILISALKDHRITVYCGAETQTEEVKIVNNIELKKFKFISDAEQKKNKEFLRIQKKIASYVIPNPKEELEFFTNFTNSPRLLQHLEADSKELDLILVTPYIFGAGVLASIRHGPKVVMIPCYHDEHFAKLNLVRLSWKLVKGFICYSESEVTALTRIVGPKPFRVVGVPIPAAEVCRRSHGNYLVYIGRKDFAKGIVELIDFVREYNRIFTDHIQLKVVGPGKIPLKFDETYTWLEDISDVPEDEKFQIIAGSLALVQPSKNESFSIVVMEAWATRVPVIVNRHCSVTHDFCKKSGGGFSVSSFDEFCSCVRMLQTSPGLRDRLGDQGYEFVRQNFNEPLIKKKFSDAIDYFLGL
ncbi:MAG: glycosyltransferase family 4 protein [Deltaproteobacteria bacterium]|nr:glycosyltransferase family 4 protein [Deltaproteobacteria bacterium]